jgi:hypothetical protein
MKFFYSIILILTFSFATPCSADQYIYTLHGIGMNKLNMLSMARYLKKEGFTVKNWGYPSTSKTIPEIAELLRDELATYSPQDTVCFVTHSMGGIVVRSFLANYAHDPRLPFIYRVVMLGPPNHGSEQADFFNNIRFTGWFLGPALDMIKADSNAYVNTLPRTLPCEVGIIAGSRGTKDGYSKRMPGDDDGLVSVQSTRLDKMDDYLIIKSMHAFINDKKISKRNTVSFLRTGKFLECRQDCPEQDFPN